MTTATRASSPEKPLPVVDNENRGYWEGIAGGRPHFQRCSGCGKFRHYPRPLCPFCRSFDYEWVPSEGLGTLHSWTVARHPVHPSFAEVPYIIGLVRMNDCGNAHVVCNLEADPAELRGDMPVEIYGEQRGDVVIPQGRIAR